MLQLPCSYTRKRHMASCLLQVAGCRSGHPTSVTTLQASVAATSAEASLLPFTGAGHFVTSPLLLALPQYNLPDIYRKLHELHC